MSAYPGIYMTEAGISPPLPVGPPTNMLWQAAPAYALGLICTVGEGSDLTYTVEVTADQIPADDGYWNRHEQIANQTGSVNSNIVYPVTAIRVRIDNYVSGYVNVGVAQWP